MGLFNRKPKEDEKAEGKTRAPKNAYSQTAIEDKIRKIKKTISEDFEGNTAINETITNIKLVEPFLKAFGWDTGSQTDIRSNYSLEGNKYLHVDYAIISRLGASTPRIIIEVIKYGDAPEKHLDKIKNYISNCDAEIAIVTDGRIYRFYLADKSAGSNQLDTDNYYQIELSDRVNLGNDNKFLIDCFICNSYYSNEQALKDALKAKIAKTDGSI